MKTTLTVALGMCLAGVASASNGGDDDDETKTEPTMARDVDDDDDDDDEKKTEPTMARNVEGDMFEESQLLGSISKLYSDGEIEVTWGGRIMIDGGWFDTDNNYPVDGEDGVEFRRSRFFAKVKIGEAVEGKAQYDFAGGDADFADVYMKVKTPVGKVQVGHFKQPFSLEELTSSRFITFMERAIPIEAFSPARDTGIGLGGMIGDSSNWGIGAFRKTDSFGEDSGDGDYGYTGRLTTAFGEGENIVHLGGAATVWGGLDDYRVRTRPEAHLLDRVFDTGEMKMDGSQTYGVEAAIVRGPFSAQGEYIINSIDDFGDTGGTDLDFSGYYGFISYFLTGEHRNYSKKGGKFDRVRPNENYDGANWGGAWEVALRYSMGDFDDGPFMTEVSNITAGLNWYLNPNARIMFNVITSNVDDSSLSIDDDMTAFMVRFQIDW